MKEEAMYTEFSSSTYAWKQFRSNSPAMWSLKLLVVLIITAVFAPVLANDKPLYCKYKGKKLFPAFSLFKNTEVQNPDGKPDIIQYDIADWKHMDLESVWWPLCVYPPEKSDYSNADYISPSGKQF